MSEMYRDIEVLASTSLLYLYEIRTFPLCFGDIVAG